MTEFLDSIGLSVLMLIALTITAICSAYMTYSWRSDLKSQREMLDLILAEWPTIWRYWNSETGAFEWKDLSADEWRERVHFTIEKNRTTDRSSSFIYPELPNWPRRLIDLGILVAVLSGGQWWFVLLFSMMSLPVYFRQQYAQASVISEVAGDLRYNFFFKDYVEEVDRREALAKSINN